MNAEGYQQGVLKSCLKLSCPRSAPAAQTARGLAAIAAITLAGAASAQAPSDTWIPTTGGPLRYYDATKSALARSVQPDWDSIFGRTAPPVPASGRFGAPTVEVRRNFVYIEDSDGTLRIPFQSQNDFSETLDFALRQTFMVLPDEFTFVYLFTSFETGVGAFFYAPQAQTDRGIGQQIFDQTGPSPLEGFVFMNYWKSFDQQFPGAPRDVIDGFARSVFNQEAGHRWGVQFDFPRSDPNLAALLGRDDAHWSYFAQTGGSPMEGNRWRDNGNGTFTTTTDVRKFDYSDVDLYLMGLLAPDQVQPWFLISNPNVTGLRDIYNQALNKSSPPQVFSPMTLRGTRTDYTIDDVTGALGRRVPAQGAAPTRWRVVFVMMAGRTTTLRETQKAEFEDMVDGYADAFRTGSRNLGTLDYVLVGDPPKKNIGDVCDNTEECDPEQSLICAVPGVGSTTAICTGRCDDATQCPADWCCGLGADSSLGRLCFPGGQCAEPPDAGPPDLGISTPDAGPAPDAACTCDLTTACETNCACDPECAPTVCTCDLTTVCDPNCGCDPECKAVPTARSGCSATGPRTDLLGALALAFLARRRRRG